MEKEAGHGMKYTYRIAWKTRTRPPKGYASKGVIQNEYYKDRESAEAGMERMKDILAIRDDIIVSEEIIELKKGRQLK